jgi:hypothetical protein
MGKFKRKVLTECAHNLEDVKAHLEMQPHGSEGWFRIRPTKFCYMTTDEIFK